MTGPNAPDFSFSDLVAGYVTGYDPERRLVDLHTSGGTAVRVRLDGVTAAEFLRNLGEPYVDASGHLDDMLTAGPPAVRYGVFYPESARPASTPAARASSAARRRLQLRGPELVGQAARRDRRVLPAGAVRRGPDRLPQLPDDAPARRRQDRQLPPGDRHHLPPGLRLRLRLPADRRRALPGSRREGHRVPARPHALLRPGREHRLLVPRHRRRRATASSKVFASEFGDDYDAIPAYEQIYALAGPIQTYRITGDPRILRRRRATRSTCSTGSTWTASRAATSRTSTRSRSTRERVARAPTARRRTGTRSATTPRPT